MKCIKNMWRYGVLMLLWLCAGCHAWAQNIVFSAVPSANKMGVKDRVQVDYTLKNIENLTDLRPGNFSDFVVLSGPHQYNTVSFVNGAKTVSVSFSYVLQPKHEGALSISPAVAKDAAGHTYQSNAVSIQVVAGSLAPQQQRHAQVHNGFDPFADDDDDAVAMMQQMQQQMQQMQRMMNGSQPQQRVPQPPRNPQQQIQPQAQPGKPEPAINDAEIKKDLFIKVAVDKSKVHVGEQITTSYKLYSRIPMQISISKLPTLNGFWTQDFTLPHQPKPEIEEIDGKKYQVFLLKKSALFPQEAGTLELDPAEAKGVARIAQQVRRSAADIFGGGSLMMNDPYFRNTFYNTTSYKDVDVHLLSTPVKITVTALPDKGKPQDYGGAVGNFTISGKLDKQEVTTDDIATLTLNITGSGNLKLIEAPKPQLPNGLTIYDPVITDTITGRTTTISGSKIITYAITPATPGDYDIPAVPFTYFNSQTGSYITLQTTPFKLHVKPGKHYSPPALTGNKNLTAALKDIHGIDTRPLGPVTAEKKPLLFTLGYWSLYALPLLAFVGLLVYKRRSDEEARDSVLLRKKRANKIALQRLVTAKKLLLQNDKKPFYDEVSKAIWLYLSDKVNIPLSALSRDTAREALIARRVPEPVQANLESVIWECETSLYASGGSKQMAHTYDEAVKVISDLEDAIKKA